MGTISLPNLDAIMQIKDPKQQMTELINTVGILIKNLSELNGYINTKNVKEISGWQVNTKYFISKAGDVGLATDNDTADPVRLFAGDTDKNAAPWRVTQAGKMHATGATIESVESGNYPRIILDPTGPYILVQESASNTLEIDPTFVGVTTPALVFRIGSFAASISGFSILGANSLQISSAEDIDMIVGSGHYVYFGSWANIYSNTEGEDLATALNNKADTFSGYSGTYSDGTNTITVVNGIITSVV